MKSLHDAYVLIFKNVIFSDLEINISLLFLLSACNRLRNDDDGCQNSFPSQCVRLQNLLTAADFLGMRNCDLSHAITPMLGR